MKWANMNRVMRHGLPVRTIRLNRYGNWNGYEGGEKAREFGSDEWAARDWLHWKREFKPEDRIRKEVGV